VVRIDGELREEPAVRADLLGVIGRSYYGLGLYDEARRVLGTAVALRQRVHDTGPALAEDEAFLAQAMHDAGDDASTTDDSIALLAIRTARHNLPADDPRLARILTTTARIIDESGHPARAESLLMEAIAILHRQPHVDRLLLSDALRTLGAHRWAHVDLASAETLYVQALALRRDTLGAGHPDVGDLDARLGEVLAQEGKPEAERYLREGIAVKQRTLGAAHPAVLQNLEDLGWLLGQRGDYTQAESLLTLVVDGSKRFSPEGNQVTAEGLVGLGDIALERGDTTRALSGYREAWRLYARITPPAEEYSYGGVLERIAEIDIAQGRFGDAEPLLLRSLKGARSQFGDANPRTQKGFRELAELYELWGKPNRAREYRLLAGSTPAPR
jgi:tetratricopeptide (TPR) repeat protein